MFRTPRTRTHRIGGRIAATALVLSATITAGSIATSAAAPRSATGSAFTLVGSDPGAAAQPTARGKAIVDLQAHGGRIYTGYGDYDANTGPIAVSPYTPGAGFTTEFVADTEAIYNYREIDGQLVAPSTDPKRTADFSTGGPWEGHSPLGAYHVFDTASLGAGDRWMVGSQGMDAVAWRSTDGGVTWHVALRVGSQHPEHGDFARFYFAGVLDGKLYVQASDAIFGIHPGSHVFDGSQWSDGPSVVGRRGNGFRPVEFNGALYFQTLGQGVLDEIRRFDGRRTASIGLGYDAEVVGNQLLVLTDKGEVRSTLDGKQWRTIATAPQGARSVTVLDGHVYVGTTAGQLWKFAI